MKHTGRCGTAVMVVLLLATTFPLIAGATTLQPLTGVRSLVTGNDNSCAVLPAGHVDCWGNGPFGQLGNGTFYTTGNDGSAIPVVVKGVGSIGALGAVNRLTTDGDGDCALLTSGKVDCWGSGYFGQLGNGTFYTTGHDGSAVPVAVKGIGGIGTLGAVAGIVSDGFGYCARLTNGHVDCWGAGSYGQLGNGTFYAAGHEGSALPVAVKGIGSIGTLGSVASLTGLTMFGYCAVLASGKVDCWGAGYNGELGNGTFYTSGNGGSAAPVAVKGIGGTGTLGSVASVTSDEASYCARLTTGHVECWGDGEYGELGNGTFYTTGYGGSAAPVVVKGIGGTGTLGNVAGLASDVQSGIWESYCALLTTGKVDCWGAGDNGQLGNGTFYTSGHEGSAVPVVVKGIGGTGILGAVVDLISGGPNYCARLATGQVDCWGAGNYGQLGNGTFYTTGHEGSAIPVVVKGAGGTGTLGAVADLTTDGVNNCARLTDGQVDCWGYGPFGDLGNGTFYDTGHRGSDVPVVVGK